MKKMMLAIILSAITFPTFSMTNGTEVTVQNNTAYSILQSYHICGRFKPQYISANTSETINLVSSFPLYLSAQSMADEPLVDCEIGVNTANNTPTVYVKDMLANVSWNHFSCKLVGNIVVIDSH